MFTFHVVTLTVLFGLAMGAMGAFGGPWLLWWVFGNVP
jgi:hypothetical protein